MERSQPQSPFARPDILPVFAVPGAILLPGGRVPLMVFEPRYLALVDAALGAGRLFGLVQPCADAGGGPDGLYPVGTLARISAFGETGDGRYLITAAGLHRFRLDGEEDMRDGYRRVRADYTPFAGDGNENGRTTTLPERARFLALLKTHLGQLGLGADLEALEKLSDADLTDRMAMVCPFLPEEKQVLLEAPSHVERCHLMMAILQRELLATGGGSTLH
jgi:uncharacterized protein